MKTMNLKSSQSGFSLVELMVVVAIIGILATMSIGAIQKQILKARQSEAKTQLASIFTSEKTFFAEFNAYSGGFSLIGYTPEGNLRYNVGFVDAGPNAATLEAKGVNAAQAGAPGNFNTVAECPADGSGTCRSLAEAVAGGALDGAVAADGSTFVAGARSELKSGNNVDHWTMNQDKTMDNPSDGLMAAATKAD